MSFENAFYTNGINQVCAVSMITCNFQALARMCMHFGWRHGFMVASSVCIFCLYSSQ